MSRRERKKRHRRQRKQALLRRLFLVDIENYAGQSRLSCSDVELCSKKLSSNLLVGDQDVVVVGTSHSENCINAKLGWQGPCRHVFKRGHNGADIALAKAISDYDLSAYSAVYIVSGDHYFAPLANDLESRGADVLVVFGNGAPSKDLMGIRHISI